MSVMDDEEYGMVLGTFTPSSPDALSRHAKVPKDCEVTQVHAGSRGVTYRLGMNGPHGAPITVKQTRFDTFVCNTCGLADKCAHSKYVRKVVDAGNVGRTAA
jgi:hypothetical protein